MDRWATIFERVKTYCTSAADLVHLQEATKCTKWLCEREGGNLEVVVPAIMLHDVGWSQLTIDEQRIARASTIDATTILQRHGATTAMLARKVLQDLGYDTALTNEIVDIVSSHDSKGICRSLNDAIVKDGNILSRFTNVGFGATCTRFGYTEEQLSTFLRNSVDKGFLTQNARLAARLHLSKRRLRSSATMATSGGIIDRLLEIFLALGDRVLHKAQQSLEEIAIDTIKQRLMDIKGQLGIYLQCHPELTLDDLQQCAEFQALAIQPIFDDGFIGIIDIRTDNPRCGQVIFHPDPRMVNQPRESLEMQRPRNVTRGFWDWYERAITGEEFFAYYHSKDIADRTKEKVQWVSPLRVGAFEWAVVASAYVDQSFHHANALVNEISSSVDVMLDELDANMLLPLSKLIAESEIISAGDLSHRVHVDVDNELSLLGSAFNKMIQSMEDSNQQLHDYARRTEEQRDELRQSLDVIREQQTSIAALSVPVIRVWEHVLVLPLVGHIDEARGRRITETILPRVVEERAHYVFIDLTGVSVAGPDVVDTLVGITRAIGLLGAECTVTGINSQIARALVEAHAGLGGIRTAMNLQHGLRRVLHVQRASKVS